MGNIQAYVRTIRIGRKITQAEIADIAGLSLRAYIDWEVGKTEAIKEVPLFRVIDALDANLQHIRYLILNPDSSVDQAVEMAQSLIMGTDVSPNNSELPIYSKQDIRLVQAMRLIYQIDAIDSLLLDNLLEYGKFLIRKER